MPDPFLKDLILPSLVLIPCLMMFLRAWVAGEDKKALLIAFAAPLLVLFTGPWVWRWVFQGEGVFSAPRITIGTSVITVIATIGILISADAGTAPEKEGEDPRNLKTIRLPWRSAPVILNLARKVSHGVRRVRNASILTTAILIVVVQVYHVRALMFADYASAAIAAPDVVWSLLSSKALVPDGNAVHILTTDGVRATFHCDDLTLSPGPGLRITSAGIQSAASVVCGLAQIDGPRDLPASASR